MLIPLDHWKKENGKAAIIKEYWDGKAPKTLWYCIGDELEDKSNKDKRNFVDTVNGMFGSRVSGVHTSINHSVRSGIRGRTVLRVCIIGAAPLEIPLFLEVQGTHCPLYQVGSSDEEGCVWFVGSRENELRRLFLTICRYSDEHINRVVFGHYQMVPNLFTESADVVDKGHLFVGFLGSTGCLFGCPDFFRLLLKMSEELPDDYTAEVHHVASLFDVQLTDHS